MNLIIWAYLAMASWPNAFAMYYVPKQEIFQPPIDHHLRNNSYFGYSITYAESSKQLVISAPNENMFGEVYYCNIEDKACIPIVKDKKVPSNHSYWFGATVKAGKSFVMMCAPRYLLEEMAQGTCYFYANRKLFKNRKINLKQRYADAGPDSDTKYKQLAMDSFGWSIDVASDGSIMVGGPGMFHGRAMIYKNINDRAPNFIKATNHTPRFNFGYAVASGSFIDESLSYAVSSTYGTIGYGEVAFYKDLKFIDISNNPLNGSALGSMFGAVLCAATLSGNRTDLLVGAPTYATNSTYNLGAVYVYLALTENSIPVFKRKIVGQISRSMFGSAIVNVGDLSGDGKHEIAIGAPFENDGHGVVYLYSGADLISNLTERELKFLQKIEPQTGYGESFGMSLTALQDFDENGCKELAIGSPFKDTVVLLRCVATVDVEILAKPPNLQGRASSNRTDFEFEVCLSIKYPSLPKKIIALISTTVEMFHEYAKLTYTNNTSQFIYETSLNDKKPDYCKNVSFSLPVDQVYDSKIYYTISSKLLNDPRTLPDFNSSRVIISNRSILTIQDSFWAEECFNMGNTCVPNFMLTPYISFQRDGDPYIIGSSKTENMSITVYNGGDVAYGACVRVHIMGVNVLNIPTGCAYESLANTTGLVCKPPKPIRTSQTWTIGQIILEMTHLTNLDKNIFINMLIFDRCMNNVTEKIQKMILVMADPRGITVKGETDIGSTVNVTKDEIDKSGKKMQHIYTIMNKGPTNWKQLLIQVTLQPLHIEYDTDTPVTVYNSTSNSYTPCLPKADKSHVCLIESLMTNVEFARIHVPIHVVPGTLSKIINKHNNVTITSFIQPKFTKRDNKYESITTVLILQEATVPIETTIVAVVIGLSIIIVTTVILYKVGFLRRKNKEALEQLKTSVKRQTVMNTSTMQSHAPSQDDQSPILEQED